MRLGKTSRMSRDDRWQQRLQNLNRAYDCLARACGTAPEDERQLVGILHFFQMTFELCWKTLKDKLADEGIDVASPKETIKRAFAVGLIADAEPWLDALMTRNIFTHAYNEEMAQLALSRVLESYLPMVRDCVAHLNSLTEHD